MEEKFFTFVNIFLNFNIDALNFLFSALPDSPFSSLDIPYNVTNNLPYLAWVLPIEYIVKITLAWIPCIFCYFGVSAILRFFKVIE